MYIDSIQRRVFCPVSSDGERAFDSNSRQRNFSVALVRVDKDIDTRVLLGKLHFSPGTGQVSMCP